MNVAAIRSLDRESELEQIETILKKDEFIQALLKEYLGRCDVPDWSKKVSKEVKQFFRLFHLANLANAKAMTIRLDHEIAEAALAAPRGPADYLGQLIHRTLSKLGIQTELTFNLEFVHGSNGTGHPLHLHGVCVLADDKVAAAVEALKNALAPTYRQRFANVAVLVEKPNEARWWASYCLKEMEVTAELLRVKTGNEGGLSYSSRTVSQSTKALYTEIAGWLT